MMRRSLPRDQLCGGPHCVGSCHVFVDGAGCLCGYLYPQAREVAIENGVALNLPGAVYARYIQKHGHYYATAFDARPDPLATFSLEERIRLAEDRADQARAPVVLMSTLHREQLRRVEVAEERRQAAHRQACREMAAKRTRRVAKELAIRRGAERVQTEAWQHARHVFDMDAFVFSGVRGIRQQDTASHLLKPLESDMIASLVNRWEPTRLEAFA